MKKYIKPAMVQVSIDNEAFLAGSATGTSLNDTGFNKNNAALGKGMDDYDWDDEDF